MNLVVKAVLLLLMGACICTASDSPSSSACDGLIDTACTDAGCSWVDVSSKQCISKGMCDASSTTSVCDNIKGKTLCKNKGCTWRTLAERQCMGVCETSTTKGKCNKESDCIWHDKKCKLFACDLVTQKGKCGNNKCYWQDANKRCANSPQPCGELNRKWCTKSEQCSWTKKSCQTALTTTTAVATTTTNTITNRNALIQLYLNCGGSSWKKKNNWNTAEPLSNWYGVTVNGAGEVIKLELGYNNLICEIPAVIGQLTNLEYLTLWGNKLSGKIPAVIGQLVQLKWLDLSDNELTGKIPAVIGQLVQLNLLNLSQNELTGEIPNEIGRLTNLQKLALYDNKLSGIDAFVELMKSKVPQCYVQLEKDNYIFSYFSYF